MIYHVYFYCILIYNQYKIQFEWRPEKISHNAILKYSNTLLPSSCAFHKLNIIEIHPTCSHHRWTCIKSNREHYFLFSLFSTFVLISLLAHPLIPPPPSRSLCSAELIECLNKLINHWHWWKTDRSGEVMFIKLPPICFFLIPVVVYLLNMHIFPSFTEISLPWPRLTVHTLIHYLWFCIEDKLFFSALIFTTSRRINQK